jgi:hypothetical protein
VGTELEGKNRMGLKTKPPATTPLAGETLTEGSSELRHPERIARLGHLKARAVSMGSWLNDRPGDLLAVKFERSLRGCANYMLFHHYFTVAEIRLAKVHTCKVHLLCPFCAHARGTKTLSAYLERLEVLKAAKPTLRLAMLTLTVKNGPDLNERFEHLEKSFKTYCARRRDSHKKQRGYNEFSKIAGAFFSYELTKKTDGWHPHLHAIVVLDEWIDQKKLSSEWLGITGDSFIVDIRRIKGDPVEGFKEVCKYALKFGDLDHEENWEAFIALKGRRLQGSFGCFRGVVVPEGATDNLLELPFTELHYQYRHGAGYALTQPPKKRT